MGGFFLKFNYMRVLTLEELEQATAVFMERVVIYNPIQASIYQNQINLGCRFNDVYKLEKWQIVNSLTVSLRPQKNNSLRVFNKSDLDFMLLDQLENEYNYYSKTSYSDAISVFFRMFPYPRIKVKNKFVKTHVFRHIKAKQLKRDGMSDNDIRLFLGENMQRSANDYIYSTVYQDSYEL